MLPPAVVLLAFLSALVAAPGGAAAQKLVRLASAQHSIGSLPIVLAKQNGFFQDENITIEVTDFRGGAPAVQALAAGSVDACICAGDHAVRLRSRGQGGTVLVALTEIHGYALVALAGSPASDLVSLRGQRIGITSPGSLTDNTLRYFIAQAGFDADRDFQLIGIGIGGPMRAAIENRSVAAGMLTTPDVQAALATEGKFKVVQDFRNLKYAALDLVVTERWLRSNTETARALARAVVRGAQLVRTDPAAVERAIAELFPALTPELRTLLAEEAKRVGSPDGIMSREGYDLMIKMLQIGDPALKPPAYEDVVALDLLPQPAHK